MRRLIPGAAGLTCLGASIVVGTLNMPVVGAQAQDAVDWQTRAGRRMAFDVASIKPDKGPYVPANFSLDPSDDYGETNGRFTGDETLAGYIQFAYKVWGNEAQSREFSHWPKWLSIDRYAIEGRTASRNPTKDQMRLMVQALLADRFRLKTHFETRVVPVFELQLAKPGKPGPKLISHADGPGYEKSGPAPVPRVPDFHFACRVWSPYLDLGATMMLGSRDVSMEALAGTLSEALGGPLAFGRPIIDKTGLTGRFDFTLEWAQERRTSTGGDLTTASDPVGPTPVEALRDQLGLKLEAAKAAIPVLVIDQVDRPSAN